MSALPDDSVIDTEPFGWAKRHGARNAGPNLVGPNAIIQTRHALDELAGLAKRQEIFAASGFGFLSDRDPSAMVEADIVNALNYEIGAQLPADRAHAVMKRAGELTAQYILANRIPRAAQWLLRALPARLAQPILLRAIAANAWTFAGQARVDVSGRRIAIYDNPICLAKIGFSSCVWHSAVFRTLFQTLVDRRITIHETECVGWGAQACTFEIVRI